MGDDSSFNYETLVAEIFLQLLENYGRAYPVLHDFKEKELLDQAERLAKVILKV